MNKTIFRTAFSLLFAALLMLGLLMFCPVKASAAGESIKSAVSIEFYNANPKEEEFYSKVWTYENAGKGHFVKVTLPQRGYIWMKRGYGSDLPMVYTVYDEGGQTVWEGAYDANSVGLNAGSYIIRMQPDTGLFRINKGDEIEFEYAVGFNSNRAREIEPNNTPSSATPLPRGGLQQGYVGSGESRMIEHDTKDFWSFEAEAGHSYRMVFTQYGINGTDVKAYVTQPGAKINTKTPLTCQRRTKDGHLFVDVPIETSGTAYLMFSYSGDYTIYSIRMFDLTDHNLVEEKGRWNQKNGKWYYLDSLDEAVTGWRHIGRKWYYFDKSGVMQTGWLCENGKWYYLDSSGIMTTGWKYLNGKWYYLIEYPAKGQQTGQMATGFYMIPGGMHQLSDGSWELSGSSKVYYFDGSGAMKTGWQYVDGKWYYMSSSGLQYKGWLQSGSKWYYLAPHMLENETMTIDGHDYHFDSSGYMSTGWVLENGKWYYYSPASGRKCIGWMQIGGKWYYLDGSRNGAMVSGEWLKIGGIYYQFSADGAWVA